MKYNKLINFFVAMSLVCISNATIITNVNAKDTSIKESKNISERNDSQDNKKEVKEKNNLKNKSKKDVDISAENKDKKGKKNNVDEIKKANSDIKKESSEKKENNKIMPINREPLNEEDFMFNGISLGDSVDSLKAILGKSLSINKGNLRDKYNWDNFDITVEKEFPYSYINRRDLSLKKVLSGTGISSFYIFGENAETYRHISVGSLRENVIRSYGKPHEVLWNGKDNSYYFNYIKGNKNIYFNIFDDKVKSIKVSLIPPQYYKNKNYKNLDSLKFKDKDLSLAGFNLGEKFEPHSWQTWEKKRTGKSEEIWYYPGYGVRLTSTSKLINALFLEDSRMLTSRGITKGDSKSTLEYVYGEPHKVEVNTKGNNPQTAYIYFSPNKINLMIVYINKDKISNVVITENSQN